jgi:hypothetical protein
MKVLRAVLMLVGGFTLLLVGIAVMTNSQSSRSGTRDNSPELAPISLTAQQLYGDYSANEVAADRKYKGRAIIASGIVESINKDIVDDPYLVLQAGGFLEDVQAHLNNSQESAAAALVKGQEISVRCMGNGMILTSPMLADCEILQAPQQNQIDANAQSSEGPPSDVSAPTAPSASVTTIPSAESVAPETEAPQTQPVLTAQPEAGPLSAAASPSTQDAATAAMKAAPDVQTKILPNGAIMFLAGTAPCGVMSHQNGKFTWTSGALSVPYDDYYQGLADAYPQCEQRFQLAHGGATQ